MNCEQKFGISEYFQNWQHCKLLFNIHQSHSPAFYYMSVETRLQATGVIVRKDKEKLTTQTELSILDTGIAKIDRDQELYTLQTDKCSTKGCGTKTSI